MLISRLWLALTAMPLLAADASGTWTAILKRPEGSQPVQFRLRQQGVRLTGTATFPGTPPQPVAEGRSDEDRLTFEVQTGFAPSPLFDLRLADGRMEGSMRSGSAEYPVEATRYLGDCRGKRPLTAVSLEKPLEQQIAPGETHTYDVVLRAGDWMTARLDQFAGTFEFALYDASGQRLRGITPRPKGWVYLPFVAERAGTYRLEVKPSKATAPVCYEIAIEELRSFDKRTQAEPLPEPYLSHTIQTLKRELYSGKAGVLDAFWDQARKNGGPLVEPMEKDKQHMLVTFLWKGTPETRGVMAAWTPFSSSANEDLSMRNISKTDVWYRTVRVRHDARLIYQMVPHDLGHQGFGSDLQRAASRVADPLNPRRWPDDPKADRYQARSLLELPGAKPQRYVEKRTNVPAGEVTQHPFSSKILHNERRISVYTPPGYSRSAARYHVLFVFDETAYLSMVPVPTILDNLLAERRIPPTVAVLIGNADGARGRELPGNADFAAFLANELMPWVRSRFHVADGPTQTAVGGSSYGGIASVFAAMTYPQIFGNVLCQSGSFWWAPWRDPANPAQRDELREPTYYAQEFLKRPKLPIKFYMDAGSFEADIRGNGVEILASSRHFRDVLRAKGYEVTYQEFAGGHDYRSWRGTFSDGLIALWGVASEK